MCSSGRIVNYLKAMLGDERHDVLFVGYQAEGTTGRQIQRFAHKGGYVEMDEQRYVIRAQVHTIGGYSAHADQKGLLGFVTRMRQWPSDIRIAHGDAAAKAVLAERLQAYYVQAGREVRVTIPAGGQ